MKRSTVTNLPLDIIIEVKRRLRAGTCNQSDIVTWLNASGYTTTKSSLNRYAMNLRKDDNAGVIDREIMAIKGADVVALFEELAVLKAREAVILTQIRMAITP